MKEEWLDRLRTRLHGECGEEAPRGLLDDIRKEMERRGAAPVRPVRQKAATVPMWIRRTASAAAVVAMVLYIGSRFGGQSPVSPQTAGQTDGRTAAVPARPGQTDPAVRHPAGARTAMSEGIPEQASAYGLLASLSYSGEKGAASCGSSRLREDREQGEATAATAVRPPLTDSGTELPGGTDSGLPAVRQPGKRPSTGEKAPAGAGFRTGGGAYVRDGMRPSRFSIGTSYSGTAGTSTDGGGMMLATADPYGSYGPEFSGVNVRNQPIRADETRTHTKHRQPVKFGLSARYALSDRWSLLAGVSYSRHSSEFTYNRNGSSHTVEQQLHYVGLPVGASYSLVRKGKVHVYATAGGEIEKLVKGESRQTAEDLSAGGERTPVKESRPVFSVNAALGAEYRFGREVSIYVEPGVSRHFNNGSAVENIYKDKPTGFNLSVGVRVQVR